MFVQAKMEIEHRQLEYKTEDGTMLFEGFLAMPKLRSSPLPGVLVFHAFGGCGHFEMERAKELAKLGFVALAADIYGKGKRAKTIDEARAFLGPIKNDRKGLLKKHLEASYEAIKAVEGVNGEKVGALGYCLGGLCSLDLARHKLGLKVAISFHGTLDPLPDSPRDHFETTVQVHHGDGDFHIKKETIEEFLQEMRDRDLDWSFLNYGKAMHGFTEPEADKLGLPGVAYNKEADIRSWAAATAILKEKLM